MEEALRETVEDMLTEHEPDQLPSALRKWAADNAKADPWAFAGDGWVDEVRDQLTRRLDGSGGKYGFNTASPDGVINLYKQVLGFEPLTKVSWQGYNNSKVLADIGSLVEVRGEIVHKGTTPGDLNISGVRNWVTFVERLCMKFDAKLVEFRFEATSSGKN